MPCKIATVVVTYNRKALLQENIECLLSQTYSNQDIIIINNASTDGTTEWLEGLENEKITHINTGKNLGGAGGFQYGIRYAAEHNYDYVWVMDDDCMPDQDALLELLLAGKKLHGHFGFLSSLVKWKDGSLCKMNVQRKTVFKDLDDFSQQITPISMASFVSLFIPIRIVREVGLPIKEFFIWTDDWEYTRRISKKHRCYLVKKSVVTHKSSSNFGASIIKDSPDRLDRYQYIYRNDMYLYRREGLPGYCYVFLRNAYHILMILVKAKNEKGKRIHMIISGQRAGMDFDPEIEFPKTL